jgi:hypothetical protein
MDDTYAHLFEWSFGTNKDRENQINELVLAPLRHTDKVLVITDEIVGRRLEGLMFTHPLRHDVVLSRRRLVQAL